MRANGYIRVSLTDLARMLGMPRTMQLLSVEIAGDSLTVRLNDVRECESREAAYISGYESIDGRAHRLR